MASDRPAHRTPAEDYRDHAEFHAREDGVEIGASVVRSRFQSGDHIWECIVTDGREWHYVEVVGSGLGAFPSISTEDVELGVERFAARFPSGYRMRALLNANPLHIGETGEVRD